MDEWMDGTASAASQLCAINDKSYLLFCGIIDIIQQRNERSKTLKHVKSFNSSCNLFK